MEKTKSRFTSLDVRAVSTELKGKLEGAHLQNIYDLTYKSYLFKFAKKDLKLQLLIEAGVRVHETRYGRENPNVLPGAFAAKLRKHLRDRRLTKFEQLGYDRVLHMEFGHDTRPEQCMHLFIELYSMGNLILADYEYKIIALIREVKVVDKETGVENKLCAVGMTYSLDSFQSLAVDIERLAPGKLDVITGKESIKNALKNRLSLVTPALIEHCLLEAQVDSKKTVDECRESLPLVASTMKSLLENISDEKQPFEGVLRKTPSADGVFFDFEPIFLNQLRRLPSDEIQQHATFNEAVDEYFYALDEQRRRQKEASQEAAIESKFAAIKREQEGRITALEQTMAECLSKAHIVEANIKNVEDVIAVVRMGLENELSWNDLSSLIAMEKAKGRKTALMISRLKLGDGLIETILPDNDGVDHLVDVNINLSGHANANRYYDLRKAAINKLERTRASFVQAMKSAEAKLRADTRLHKRQQQSLIPKRKPLWFEKFNWFISSDSYLVLAGKDSQQNEFLVKRHLRPGDVYVHADMHGASSVIIKNHRRGENGDASTAPPIIHRTLIEAGAFSLCTSRAWDAKIVTSAWWVSSDQVSKTAPSGEYLSVGSFMIRGKKNFLPPSQLVLGFGFMFVVDAESAKRRRELRLQREALRGSEAAGEADEISDAKYIQLIAPSPMHNEIGEDEIDQDLPQKLVDLTLEKTGKKQEKPPKPTSSPQKKEKEKVNEKHGNAPIRGKHGQKKKIKEKYRDQDDEDREARLAILGSRGKQESKAAPPKASKDSNIPKVKAPPKPQRAVIQTTEDVSIMDGEDLVEEGERGEDELTLIDSLTGNPTSQDVLVNAIAVSAPFMVLQHFKYRVKLVPGAMKRGSAAKLAMSVMFSENKTSMTPLEKNLLRAVPEAELNSTMPGKVRLAASGVELGKAKKAVAKSKKQTK